MNVTLCILLVISVHPGFLSCSPAEKTMNKTDQRREVETTKILKGLSGNAMVNCPSAVLGATTRVEELESELLLIVTANTDEAILEIQKRAAYLAWIRGVVTTGKHTGEGTGGGRRGLCPIIPGFWITSAENLVNGSQITVAAMSATHMNELRVMVRSRLYKLGEVAAPVDGQR